MADISFLCNYKCMLYPLHFKLLPDAENGQDITHLGSSRDVVKSLVDLTAEKIVLDATVTSRTVEVVPAELSYSLMKAAILKNRDRAVEVLLSRWPFRSLRLAQLTDYMFTDLRALYSDSYVGERMRRGVQYTTSLAHTFVECLKKRSPSKLRYLDLTGYPAAEVIVNYLSAHALLAYNEDRQNEIIPVFNKVTEENKQMSQAESTLPDDRYVIKLDAFIQTKETYMQLCKALKIARQNPLRLNLHINKLDLTCLGVGRLLVLLEQVDPEYITGLCMQYNAICCEGLQLLAPVLQRLKSLTGLDLSCNNIALINNHETAEVLGEAFADLPELCRLDISNNRIKNKLRIILGKTQLPLKHLELSGCGLSDVDIKYLATSRHTKHLQILDLSENNLAKYFDQFCELLDNLGNQLITLETEDCCLAETHFTHLFYFVAKNLKSLRFWNLSRNLAPTTSEKLLADMKLVIKMQCLETFLVSYPSEIMPSSSSDDIAQEAALAVERQIYQQSLHSTLNQMCASASRNPLKVVLLNS